jgi:hypothetical protein
MLAGASFAESFRVLVQDYDFDTEMAFGLLLRVFRGGGLAKDAIYLRGLLSLLSHLKAGGALDPFWMGKISASHFSVMEELGARGLLKAPILRPLCLETDRGRARLERARAGLSPPFPCSKLEESSHAHRLFRQLHRGGNPDLYDHGARHGGGRARTRHLLHHAG